jgi:choline dehydrogenase-like flavoprotein
MLLDAAGLKNQWVTQSPFPVGHQMGTCRMSQDPGSGVVDANLKVHGTENLYVVGSSVFPTCGAVPPTLTIAALALRLADHLVRGQSLT